jgi:hypothetical protein
LRWLLRTCKECDLMAGLYRRLPAGLLLLAGLLGPASLARSCPFCTMQGQTLTGEIGQASLVIYGDVKEVLSAAPDGSLNEGRTEFAIKSVLKTHDTVKDRHTVQLGRAIPVKPGVPLLVFCDIFKGKIDPYRVTEIKNGGDLVKYLQGALRNKDKKIGERLRFFFDYLDNTDVEISNDAYREFANASYDDYKTMAKSLPADRIAGWLEDEKTQNYRLGLYASMLGHCGTRKDAKVLRDLLEKPDKRFNSGIDGVLAGYVMLASAEGWDYLQHTLENPQNNDFALRYAGLRALRFFWDSRPDLVSKEKIRGVLIKMLEQKDIADIVIEDLRKWQCWDLAERVLAVRKTKAYETPIVRRAILRYCLACPPDKSKAAVEYVAEERKNDSEYVNEVEEVLKLDQMPPAPAAKK